jgi:hypothetical protein
MRPKLFGEFFFVVLPPTKHKGGFNVRWGVIARRTSAVP